MNIGIVVCMSVSTYDQYQFFDTPNQLKIHLQKENEFEVKENALLDVLKQQIFLFFCSSAYYYRQ